MLQGFLRKSVEVNDHGSVVSLAHPCWKLDLPREWVNDTPGIAAFLRRSVAAGDVAITKTETRNLLRLLEAQGCLTFRDDVKFYTLREIKILFAAIRNEWYGYYYRHPLWEQLREGTLSKNGLVTWLIYNYFLSRTAGISAARLAIRSENHSLRQQFFHHTLEEYSHFSDFYFVRHGRLSIPDEAVEAYVQLPSSLAFSQQMLRMAETDWLGYVFIAFFQESTVQFYEDCQKFFDAVERKYGLDDLFSPWRRHIEIDIECLHADSLGLIFDSEEPISLEQLIRSLTSAWFTFRFLVLALDEILYEGLKSDSITLRSPIGGGVLDRTTNALVRTYEQLSAPVQLPTSGTALDLYNAMHAHGLLGMANSGIDHGPSTDVAFLRLDLVKSLYRALSHAETADEIIALGRIAERAYRNLSASEQADLGKDRQPMTAEAMALANFLHELARSSSGYCFILHTIAAGASSRSGGISSYWALLAPDDLTPITEFLAGWRLSSGCGDRLITKQLQMNEFIRSWQVLEMPVAPPNFFRGGQ